MSEHHEFDVVMIIRTPGGWLGVQVFRGTPTSEGLRVRSQCWNGIQYCDADHARQAARELALKLGIPPENVYTEVRIDFDPLGQEFTILPQVLPLVI